MTLDEKVERIKAKFHESDELPDDDTIKAAYVEVAFQCSDDRPADDVFYARVKERSLEKSEKAREAESLSLPYTPTDRILADAIVRALAPKIAELRIAGPRGSADAPFAAVSEAAAWIERESEQSLARWRERSEARIAAQEKIDQLAHEHGLEIERRSTFLAYQREGDPHVKHAPTIPGTYLYRLARETQRMSRHTGFPQGDLTMHVLTGRKPERGRARGTERRSVYTLPSGEQIHTNEAMITFRALDLSDKELRKVYGYIRRKTGGKGVKALTNRDEYLWTVVQDASGPPSRHGEKGRFWQRVGEKVREKYPESPSTTNGIEQSYGRILRILRPPRDD